MIALSGVRSSCDMLARNSDLCLLASSSSRLLAWISLNRRAFWIAITAWSAKVLQQRQLLVAERLRRVARDLDRADAAAFPEHRRERDREAARRLGDPRAAAPARPASARTSAKWTTRRSRIAISVAVPSSGRGNVAGDARARRFVARSPRKPAYAQHAVVVDEIDAEPARREQPLAAVEDLVEHRLRVGDRAADDLQHLGGRGLLLERLAWSR